MKRFTQFLAGSALLLVGSLYGYDLCYYFQRIKDYFIKAEKMCLPVEAIRERNVRKIPVRRDGLMTDEIARVLYRSDEVIMYQENLDGECAGIAEEQVQKRIAQLLKENSEQTVFYVSIYGTKQDWAFTICKDGLQYKAVEVTAVDLDRNYKHIFGEEAFRYVQNIYKVTFDAPFTPPFDFILCNGKNKARGTW